MKKILVVILGLLIFGSFVACGDDNNGNGDVANQTESPGYDINSDYYEPSENIEPTQNEGLIYDSTDLYEYEDYGEGIIITEFANYSVVEYDKIIVPSYIEGKKVVGIGSLQNEVHVFSYICGDCEVVIPETVEFIGTYAFFYARGLSKVSGGANCKTIGEVAFGYCDKLTEITFINSVDSVAPNAFDGCVSYNH